MENDKEEPSEKISSSRNPSPRGRGVTSNLSRLFRSQKKRLILFLNGEQLGDLRSRVRRLTRHSARFLKTQFDDIRRAVVDLKTRINLELNPGETTPVPTPRPGAHSSPLRKNSAMTSILIRPAAMAEPSAKRRRFLVVGGMDFFGAALVRHLNLRGFRDIVIVDRLENDRWKNLSPLRFEEFMSPEEFAGSRPAIRRPSGTFSHVFYLAGWDGEESPLALPKSLLASVAESGRFISLSSACSLGPNPDRQDLALGRPENLRPETRPGVLAGLFDRYAIAQLPAKNYLSLKHYRLFGLHERRDHSIYGLVKMLHEQICATGVASLPENLRPGSLEGDRRHDFFSVRDAVQMSVFLAENDKAAGMYELGSGTSSTVFDLVEAVFEALGRKSVIEWVQDPCAIPSAQPEKADLSRLREAGWSQVGPCLKESIRHYVQNDLDATGSPDDEEMEGDAIGDDEKSLSSPASLQPRIFPVRKKSYADRTDV